MNLNNKKIGIWGFGVVGKAVVTFLTTLIHEQKINGTITLFDQKPLNAEQQTWLATLNSHVDVATDLTTFLDQNDYIIPSPGICIEPYYEQYKSKWVAELDLFAYYASTPIIAITGSIGKTTITTLMAQILTNYQKKITVGGNIGIGSMNLIEQQKTSDFTVLEVSSFQLAYTKIFAPTLAIITHFEPNHLDWHGTINKYAQAKAQIFAYQTAQQHILMPFDFQRQNISLPKNKPIHFFSPTKPSASDAHNLKEHHTLFFIESNWIMQLRNNTYTPLYCIDQLPPITFTQNWLIIIAALHILKLPLERVHMHITGATVPAHRLEKLAHPHIAIYNDSKATTATATLAAVERLSTHPIHLFIGGLSKGTDREPFIAALRNKVAFVYCFGAESESLAQLCAQYQIPHIACATLEPAVATCRAQVQPGTQILFSPAGSSFDLFKNYEDRGQQFKQLIARYFADI